MVRVKEGFLRCWDGNAFRHPEYHGSTDDRVQALAVLSGIADESYYGKLSEIFRTQFHASPYMEKYVMEALFRMGCGHYAIERTARRFADMVDDPGSTTLFEGWGIGEKGYGGGTTNHAWSGGALTPSSPDSFAASGRWNRAIPYSAWNRTRPPSGMFRSGCRPSGALSERSFGSKGAALAACDRSGGHDVRRHAAAGSCRAASGRTISVGRSAARRGEIPETGTYPAEPDFRGLSNRIGVRSGAGWSAGVRILK